uniref:Matrix metallopeptidase 14a (membrane-inserted) n=1 Tax=Eptatretus burgeri TaxID=7764 RepID=A0A8C4QHD7_EPTBU
MAHDRHRPEETLHLVLLAFLCFTSSQANGNFTARTWLQRYGYLPPGDLQLSTLRSSKSLTRAISTMQEFYGIPVTGKLDEVTIHWMKKPRCGVPDIFGSFFKVDVRRRRYTSNGLKWDHNHITYCIQNHTPKLGKGETRDALRRAFGVWQAVTPLTFIEVSAAAMQSGQQPVDIVVFFAKGFHGDSSPFDGAGGYLAHAFFPGPGIGGDTHFDADEPWTLGNQNYNGNDLFIVAVHELGHALGLEHSNDPTAVMAPFYQYMDTENFVLPYDDLTGIQEIYGRPHEPEKPKPREPSTSTDPAPPRHPGDNPRTHPDICQGSFDTVAMLRGELFVFKGPWLWRVRDKHVLDGYPMSLSYFWHGLPIDIDSAFERADGKFVFFKGSKYWVFDEATPLRGYPQPLIHLGTGLPTDRIHAAVSWEPQRRTYYFQGDKYWRYNEVRHELESGYPKPIDVWGIPSFPQAAFVDRSGVYTYFMKGNKYWAFHNKDNRPEPGYPKSLLVDWLGCTSDDVLTDGDEENTSEDEHRPTVFGDDGRSDDDVMMMMIRKLRTTPRWSPLNQALTSGPWSCRAC